MTRRVGEHTIREDLYDATVDRIPKGIPIDLNDRAVGLRSKQVTFPESRSQTTEVRTLQEFYDFFRKMIAAAEEIEGRAYNVRFSEEFPPVEGELPCFTVKLIGRVPWADRAGRAERAPRYMETRLDPDQPGQQIEIYFQRFTNDIEITVWAATNKVANELADWLEEKFVQYLWGLQWCGIAHPVLFSGRGQDIVEKPRAEFIHGRPLRFSVITGRITKRNVTMMRRVRIQIGVNRPDDADDASTS